VQALPSRESAVLCLVDKATGSMVAISCGAASPRLLQNIAAGCAGRRNPPVLACDWLVIAQRHVHAGGARTRISRPAASARTRSAAAPCGRSRLLLLAELLPAAGKAHPAAPAAARRFMV